MIKNTVIFKPVNNGHSKEPQIVPSMSSWLLYTGSNTIYEILWVNVAEMLTKICVEIKQAKRVKMI